MTPIPADEFAAAVRRLETLEQRMQKHAAALARTPKVQPSRWDLVFKIGALMSPIALIVAGAGIGHEVRLSRIEETKFTNADAGELGNAIRREFRDLVREDLADIKAGQRAIDTRLRAIEIKVGK